MAVRFRFTKNYDHRIRLGVEKAYRAGHEGLIPEAHAEGAEKAGAGERLPEPPKTKGDTAPKADKA